MKRFLVVFVLLSLCCSRGFSEVDNISVGSVFAKYLILTGHLAKRDATLTDKELSLVKSGDDYLKGFLECVQLSEALGAKYPFEIPLLLPREKLMASLQTLSDGYPELAKQNTNTFLMWALSHTYPNPKPKPGPFNPNY